MNNVDRMLAEAYACVEEGDHDALSLYDLVLKHEPQTLEPLSIKA